MICRSTISRSLHIYLGRLWRKTNSLRRLPRIHRPSTSEGMPHPRKFLPLRSSAVPPISNPFLVCIFISLGYGVCWLVCFNCPCTSCTIAAFPPFSARQIIYLFLNFTRSWRSFLSPIDSIGVSRPTDLIMAHTNGDLEHSKGLSALKSHDEPVSHRTLSRSLARDHATFQLSISWS